MQRKEDKRGDADISRGCLFNPFSFISSPALSVLDAKGNRFLAPFLSSVVLSSSPLRILISSLILWGTSLTQLARSPPQQHSFTPFLSVWEGSLTRPRRKRRSHTAGKMGSLFVSLPSVVVRPNVECVSEIERKCVFLRKGIKVPKVQKKASFSSRPCLLLFGFFAGKKSFPIPRPYFAFLSRSQEGFPSCFSEKSLRTTSPTSTTNAEEGRRNPDHARGSDIKCNAS